MENRVTGLHHITAIASSAKRNLDFYTGVLGLRLVKKTVNFDDPGTYHFYYGNEVGEPGTILTFFPWEGIGKGRSGAGMATHIGYAVPQGSLAFWKEHLQGAGVSTEEGELFGEQMLSFTDPDGLNLQVIEAKTVDNRAPWTISTIGHEVALRGFHHVALTVKQADATTRVLTDILGYRVEQQNGRRIRLVTNAIGTANLVDLIEDPAAKNGYNAAGTNHHIAFRVHDDQVLMEYREKVLAAGLQITPKIDRDYFYSLYFREPGGVLFEIATDNPGFMRDESKAQLGSQLKLPKQYEGIRADIEKALPPLSF
ncbi:ring-cleaving dioxygenase [Sphingobacterium suaedae]|uniref:Ring-cleaving dioxygenase n=1 Tax=Sphingobacterium suaedae TaxID=1686402 RepID=A0ABW5KGF5_9SPHI